MRDAFKSGKLLERMVADLKYLLLEDADDIGTEVMHLWDDKLGMQRFGVQYHESSDLQ
jgi:CRISPR-associated protein Cas1